MIEAVNSVVSNSIMLRQSVRQSSGDVVETVSRGPIAPYVDKISVDTNFDTAIFEIRDNDTGDVLSQYPTESTLEARQRAESVRQRADAIQEQRSALSRTAQSAPQEAPQEDSVTEASPVQTVTIVQSAAETSPQQSRGAGEARVAIAALSTGAQSSQIPSSGTEISFSA